MVVHEKQTIFFYIFNNVTRFHNGIIQIASISGERLYPWKTPLLISASPNFWPHAEISVFHVDTNLWMNLNYVFRDFYQFQALYNPRIWDHIIGFLIVYPFHGMVLMLSHKKIVLSIISLIYNLPVYLAEFHYHPISAWFNTGQQFPHKWEKWDWSEVSYFISLI